jgi:hypothetical protein
MIEQRRHEPPALALSRLCKLQQKVSQASSSAPGSQTAQPTSSLRALRAYIAHPNRDRIAAIEHVYAAQHQARALPTALSALLGNRLELKCLMSGEENTFSDEWSALTRGGGGGTSRGPSISDIPRQCGQSHTKGSAPT